MRRLREYSKTDRETRIVSMMIRMFCESKHGKQVGAELCPDCTGLLAYSGSHLRGCRYGEAKSSCKTCPTHCYSPEMRARIRAVMRHSGPRILFMHPVAWLRHVVGA